MPKKPIPRIAPPSSPVRPADARPDLNPNLNPTRHAMSQPTPSIPRPTPILCGVPSGRTIGRRLVGWSVSIVQPVVAWLGLLAVIGLLMPAPSSAQPASAADSLMREATRLLDRGITTGSIETLQRARSIFQRTTASKSHAALSHYYTALSSYQIVNRLEEESEQDEYLDDAEAHAKTALEKRENWAEAWALLSSVYGRKASRGMFAGMRNGPKADDALERAEEIAPNNPRVLLTKGISLYNKPGMWGGDKDEAVEALRAAIAAFEANTSDASPSEPSHSDHGPVDLQPTWGHAEAYAWIGIAHENDGRPAQARAAFERALEVRPGYAWVESVLLPAVASR